MFQRIMGIALTIARKRDLILEHALIEVLLLAFSQNSIIEAYTGGKSSREQQQQQSLLCS